MYNNVVENWKKISREYRYLHGTGTVIKSTVVVPWYRQYRPSLIPADYARCNYFKLYARTINRNI